MAEHYDSTFEIEARAKREFAVDGWLHHDYKERHRALDILEKCAVHTEGSHYLEAYALYGRFVEWEVRRLHQKDWNMGRCDRELDHTSRHLFNHSLPQADYGALDIPDYYDPAERERVLIERIWMALERHQTTLNGLIAACPAGNEPGTVQVSSDLHHRVMWFKNLCEIFYK